MCVPAETAHKTVCKFEPQRKIAKARNVQHAQFYCTLLLLGTGDDFGTRIAFDMTVRAAFTLLQNTLTLSCTPELLRAFPMRRRATAAVVFWRVRGGCNSPGLKACDLAHPCRHHSHSVTLLICDILEPESAVSTTCADHSCNCCVHQGRCVSWLLCKPKRLFWDAFAFVGQTSFY